MIRNDPYALDGDVNKLVPMPVESSIYCYDPVIFLLVELGASLDVGTRQSYKHPQIGETIFDAVEALIKKTDRDLGPSVEPEYTKVDDADQPRWKAWVTESHKAAEDFWAKGNKQQPDHILINRCNRKKDYLEEVRALLKEKKAKTWNELHPDVEKEGYESEYKPYKMPFRFWTIGWRPLEISKEKVPLYEELYEACWNGDDDKVRELCLPQPEGTKRRVSPIQITCEADGSEFRLNQKFFVQDLRIAYRVHPAARCNLSSPLVDCQHCVDNCRGSAVAEI